LTYTIAITGGIASGKSAVSRLFAQLNVPVFDADLIARALVCAGSTALDEISAAFGAGLLTSSGDLNREKMRALVFADPQSRKTLEGILHPRIRKTLRRQAESAAAPFCVLAIPLLAEAYSDYAWIDRVLVTDIARDEQIRRLVARPGIDQTLAQRMIDAQAGRQARFEIADDVIDNGAPVAFLPKVVSRLHALYLRLAGGG
jgi:dephospho-CoA kinase